MRMQGMCLSIICETNSVISLFPIALSRSDFDFVFFEGTVRVAESFSVKLSEFSQVSTQAKLALRAAFLPLSRSSLFLGLGTFLVSWSV